MAEEPRYLAPFRQRDFQISCAAVSFVMLLLLICLFAGLLLRSSGDNADDRDSGPVVERIANTPTMFASLTSFAALTSATPTQFQQAPATLASTPTALVLIPGSGFVPGGFPTAVPIPFDPGIPAAPPPVVIVPTNPPPPPQPTQPPPPSNTPVPGYRMVIDTRSADSVYVINQTQSKSLPLAPLVLGDGDGALKGTEWRLDAISPGACVSAWKDTGEREDADIDCEEIGPKLTRPRGQRIWDSEFNVYYNGELLGQCHRDRCLFRLPD